MPAAEQPRRSPVAESQPFLEQRFLKPGNGERSQHQHGRNLQQLPARHLGKLSLAMSEPDLPGGVVGFSAGDGLLLGEPWFRGLCFGGLARFGALDSFASLSRLVVLWFHAPLPRLRTSDRIQKPRESYAQEVRVKISRSVHRNGPCECGNLHFCWSFAGLWPAFKEYYAPEFGGHTTGRGFRRRFQGSRFKRICSNLKPWSREGGAPRVPSSADRLSGLTERSGN